MTVHFDARLLRIVMLAIAAIGLLTVLYGAYNVIDATNRYNTLAAIPTPAPGSSVTSGEAMALAAVDRDKSEALTRRGQATSIIGVGAVILGAAVVILMRVSEQSPNQTNHA